MGKAPDYDRARNAIEFYAQKQGLELHISRTHSAFERGFNFHAQLARNGVPIWDGPYFMGSGHATPEGHAPSPGIADVLPCLFLDASCYEDAHDLLDFCAEFGFQTDTQEGRKSARNSYEACRRVAHDLRDVLSDDEYATLSHLSSMV
jgi:hypothetical protein